jgi:hypothetical protein
MTKSAARASASTTAQEVGAGNAAAQASSSTVAIAQESRAPVVCLNCHSNSPGVKESEA